MIENAYDFSHIEVFYAHKRLLDLRNGPDKNDSNNGNEHVGMQKRC